MHKEPFVITLGNEDLPNLANREDYGIEFSKTKLWDEFTQKQPENLQTVIEKLDEIIELLKKIGKD